MSSASPASYTFFEEIGQGGMGTVYRAVNDKTQEEVAIKMLHRELFQDSSQIRRFQRETRSQANIVHPNAIHFIDTFERDDMLGIVMELLKGCSLKQYIKHHGALNANEIHAVVFELLQGLDAAHTQSIIHRDLKPSNIFLCDDGSIKIMDFGLAKSNLDEDDITNTGHGPIGSYFFMAPEQILGNHVDVRTDLYAIGITLFKLATGKLPFIAHGGSQSEIMDKQVRQPPPTPESINPDVSPTLSTIILKLLEKEPDDRFQSCQELSEAFVQLGNKIAPSLSGKEKIKCFSDLQNRSNQTTSILSEALAQEKKENAENHVVQNTLLWVFQDISPIVGDKPPIDLTSPPAITVENLKRLREAISTIPPLPEIWHDIQRVLNDPHAAASDLAKLVEKDAVLTAHVLKICNSAAYAIPGSPPVTHIAVALTRLGMDAAQDVILQMIIPEFGDPSSSKEIQYLSFHAQGIALFTRMLADYSQIVGRQSASMFGILHDIGKLVILHLEDEDTLEQLRARIAKGTSALKAEWDTLGYTHIDAGMMLALHWKLPRSIHRFIYFHHHPCLHHPDTWPRDVQPAIMLVHLAHIMLSNMLVDENMLSIWQRNLRSHVAESKTLMYRPLQLPVHDVSLYNQMEQEFKRLQLHFPALFVREL